jgi:hypothetical protein
MSSERRYLYVPELGPRNIRKDCCEFCERVNDCPLMIARCCPHEIPMRTCADCQPCNRFKAPVFRTALDVLREAVP